MTRPRRSLLFMPGANVRALEKARELPADTPPDRVKPGSDGLPTLYRL